jgi:hypothetical protein
MVFDAITPLPLHVKHATVFEPIIMLPIPLQFLHFSVAKNQLVK